MLCVSVCVWTVNTHLRSEHPHINYIFSLGIFCYCCFGFSFCYSRIVLFRSREESRTLNRSWTNCDFYLLKIVMSTYEMDRFDIITIRSVCACAHHTLHALSLCLCVNKEQTASVSRRHHVQLQCYIISRNVCYVSDLLYAFFNHDGIKEIWNLLAEWSSVKRTLSECAVSNFISNTIRTSTNSTLWESKWMEMKRRTDCNGREG